MVSDLENFTTKLNISSLTHTYVLKLHYYDTAKTKYCSSNIG